MRVFSIHSLAAIALIVSTPLFAGQREDLLSRYAAEAKAAAPSFAGFSAVHGKSLHNQNFSGGKADTPACAACHGQDPRRTGTTRTGKVIEAMAVSVMPSRFIDPAKVEKWFRRNCQEVMGRTCSAQEKGDWLSYMNSL